MRPLFLGLVLLLVPAVHAQSGDILFQRGNKDACGVTTAATFTLKSSSEVGLVSVWSRFSGDTELGARLLSARGTVVASGPATKGTCDSFQREWCLAELNVGTTLPAGTYTVDMEEPRICINAGVESGFVNVHGPAAAAAMASSAASIEWTTTVTDKRGQNGSRFTFTCPSGNPGSVRVWGTDTYTDDSSVCGAAVHAGVLSASGGTVTVEIVGGQSSYASSTRNGVTSTQYGEWSGSFRVVGSKAAAPPQAPPPPAAAPATSIGWTDSATNLRGQNGSRFRFQCPAGDPSGGRAVWGTGVYTDDSGICAAAVHAGAISRSGGTVTIEILAGQSSYTASSQNGVSTSNYGAWSGSFRVVR